MWGGSWGGRLLDCRMLLSAAWLEVDRIIDHFNGRCIIIDVDMAVLHCSILFSVSDAELHFLQLQQF